MSCLVLVLKNDLEPYTHICQTKESEYILFYDSM